MPAATSEPSTAAGASTLYLPLAVTLPRTAAASMVSPESTVMVSREIFPLAVHLVEEQVPRRHRTQTHGAVGAGQDQHPARKLLAQHRVAAVPRAPLLDPLAQDLALLDQWVEPLLGVALCQLH